MRSLHSRECEEGGEGERELPLLKLRFILSLLVISMSRPVYSQPPGATPPIKEKFMSSENRHMLYGLLTKDLAKRGYSITGETAEQLEGYLDHYIGEVFDVQGPKPLQFLNKETLLVTATEFAKTLKAAPAKVKAAVAAAVSAGPVVAARAVGRPPAREVEDEFFVGGTKATITPDGPASTSLEALFQDTNTRLDGLQKERAALDKKPKPPPIPEFKMDFTDDGPSPMELYERAKKAREKDGLLIDTPVAKKVDVLVPAESRPPRVTVAGVDMEDARERGVAIASPNLVPPPLDDRKILSQQVVIKDDDVVAYKETENNLYVYSADRDWYGATNTTDNRYNFYVSFDPANNKQTFGLNPAANVKFRNIVRIEFVKAIIPAEGLDVIIQQDASGSPTYSTSNVTNSLSFPYLNLRVGEFDANNYGTDNNLDNAFAVLQYDANWGADTTNSAYKGYYAFIPKSMKAQREWKPTPLATLTRLTLRLERPDGTLVQSGLDTNSVADVVGSNEAGALSTVYYTPAGSAARYIFVKTSTYFSQFAVQKGDRILFQQFVATNVTYPEAALQMMNYMNQTSGLVVVGIANDTVAAGTIVMGANTVGYANYIVFEVEMADPTTGSTAVNPFGANATDHNAFLAGSTTYSGKLINLNRQTQFVFRVITRELDAATRLRPDNLN